MKITIGKRTVTISEATTKAIKDAIEKDVMMDVIFMKWIDPSTLYYTCSGSCEVGHKLVSGNVKVLN